MCRATRTQGKSPTKNVGTSMEQLSPSARHALGELGPAVADCRPSVRRSSDGSHPNAREVGFSDTPPRHQKPENISALCSQDPIPGFSRLFGGEKFGAPGDRRPVGHHTYPCGAVLARVTCPLRAAAAAHDGCEAAGPPPPRSAVDRALLCRLRVCTGLTQPLLCLFPQSPGSGAVVRPTCPAGW